jgi:hypothetical protein
MITTADMKEKTSVTTVARLTTVIEILVVCPGCKAFETLQFSQHRMVNTRKFTQVGDYIYHDCGTGLIYHLFY